MIRPVTFMILGVLFAAQALQAEVKLEFDPTYKQGDVVVTSVETNVAQNLTISGMDVVTQADNFIEIEETVVSVTPQETRLQGKFRAMLLDLSLPGGLKVNFDSGNPNAEIPVGPLAETVQFMKSLSGTNWETILDRKKLITAIKYPDSFLNSVPEAFKDQVSLEKRIKEQKMNLARLPEKPVSVGDVWTRNEEADLGSGQTFYLVKKYSYVGPEQRDGKTLEKIKVETESIQYDLAAGGGLPVQVKESDLKVKSSGGTLWYDAKSKVVVEFEDTMHITGTLTLSVNGMDLPAELDLTISSKVSRNQ